MRLNFCSSVAEACCDVVLCAFVLFKPVALLERMELSQQLLSFGFQGGNSRLENLVGFLVSQDVGRIEDLIGMACIPVLVAVIGIHCRRANFGWGRGC